jgi:hypothetical protein
VKVDRQARLNAALARHREEREQERSRVIEEFDNDIRALASELIYLRRVLDNVSEAVGLARAEAPFVVMGPGPHWHPGKDRNGRRTGDEPAPHPDARMEERG